MSKAIDKPLLKAIIKDLGFVDEGVYQVSMQEFKTDVEEIVSAYLENIEVNKTSDSVDVGEKKSTVRTTITGFRVDEFEKRNPVSTYTGFKENLNIALETK